MSENPKAPIEPPKKTPEQLAAAQKAAAAQLHSANVTTPIPQDLVKQPQEAMGGDEGRAVQEATLQASGRKNIPMPASEIRDMRAPEVKGPAGNTPSEGGKSLKEILHKQSAKQTEALAKISAVRQECGRLVGKRGCNPFLYNKEILIPLEALVEEGDADAIEYCITSLVCPEKPNSGEKPGPLLVSQASLLRKRQMAERARVGGGGE